MNGSNENFEFPNLEQNIEWFKDLYRIEFPEMSESTLDKNAAFIKLLEEYKWETIYGMDDFLEDKWYDLEGIRLNNGQWQIFTPELRKDIEAWKFLLWVKMFFEEKIVKTESWEPRLHTEYSYYYIIAKKKDKFWIDGLVSSMKEFIHDMLHNKQTN